MCDERAELVCVKPFPSMPVFFWNDEGGIKYKKAYFNRYPGNRHAICMYGYVCTYNIVLA